METPGPDMSNGANVGQNREACGNGRAPCPATRQGGKATGAAAPEAFPPSRRPVHGWVSLYYYYNDDCNHNDNDDNDIDNDDDSNNDNHNIMMMII